MDVTLILAEILPFATNLFGVILNIGIPILLKLLTFCATRAIKIPFYLQLLKDIATDEKAGEGARKICAASVLLAGSVLAFMAFNFVPFVAVPIIGIVPWSIAILLAVTVIFAAFEAVTAIDSSILRSIAKDETKWLELQKDIDEFRNILGPKLKYVQNAMSKTVASISKVLLEKTAISAELLDALFKSKISDLLVFTNKSGNVNITLPAADIKTLTGAVESWQKLAGSAIVAGVAGSASAVGASSIVTSILAPLPGWATVLPGGVQAWFWGGTGKVLVTASVFGGATAAAPIVAAAAVGLSTISGTMYAYDRLQKKKLSQNMADILIACLPMAYADLKFSEEERNTILQILKRPFMRKEDEERVLAHMNSSVPLTFDDIVKLELFKESNEKKRAVKLKILLAIAWEVANADGSIDPNEIELHSKMAFVFGVEQHYAQSIREFITPSLLALPAPA